MKDSELALEIAKRAHQGQVDKGGHPYIEHPMAVAEGGKGEKFFWTPEGFKVWEKKKKKKWKKRKKW